MGLGEEILMRLGLDQSTLQSGMNKARLQVKGFAEETKSSFNDILKELAAPLTAVGVIAGVEKVFGKVEEIERVTAATGLAAEAYQKFAFAASKVGVDSGAVEVALEKLNRTLGEAGGTGPEAATAQKYFQEFGIAIKDSNGHMRGTGDLLDEISGKMSAMADPAQKAEMAMELFGRSGAKLISVLQEWKDKHGEGAMFLTNEDIESIKMAHSEIDQLTNSMTVMLGKAIAWAGFFKEDGNFSVGWRALTHGIQYTGEELEVDNALKRQKADEDAGLAAATKRAQKLADDLAEIRYQADVKSGKVIEVLNAQGQRHKETLTKKQLDKYWHDAIKIENEVQDEIKKVKEKGAKDNLEIAKKYYSEEARFDVEKEKKKLTEISLLARENREYYHTIAELAATPSWNQAGNTAREIEWRQKRLAEYTLTHPLSWQETAPRWYSTRDRKWHGGETSTVEDTAFATERDYIHGLKQQLEAAGYTSPDITMEKMSDNLKALTDKFVTTQNGLKVDASIGQ